MLGSVPDIDGNFARALLSAEDGLRTMAPLFALVMLIDAKQLPRPGFHFDTLEDAMTFVEGFAGDMAMSLYKDGQFQLSGFNVTWGKAGGN